MGCIVWAVENTVTVSSEGSGFSFTTITPNGGPYESRHQISVTSMAISGENVGSLQRDTFLTLGQADDFISMWYIGSGSASHQHGPRTAVLQGHQQSILTLAFRGNDTLISGSAGGELFL
jgi:hypothetical protein